MGQMRVGKPAFTRLRLDSRLRVAGRTSSTSQREPNRLRHRRVHPPGARSGHRLHVLIAQNRRRRPAFVQLRLNSQTTFAATINPASPRIPRATGRSKWLPLSGLDRPDPRGKVCVCATPPEQPTRRRCNKQLTLAAETSSSKPPQLPELQPSFIARTQIPLTVVKPSTMICSTGFGPLFCSDRQGLHGERITNIRLSVRNRSILPKSDPLTY